MIKKYIDDYIDLNTSAYNAINSTTSLATKLLIGG